jgi:dihydropteroate synthase
MPSTRAAWRIASAGGPEALTSWTLAANPPGLAAAPVPLDEELARVLPVVREAVTLGVPVSVDTYKPEVMQARCSTWAPTSSTTSGRCASPARVEVVAPTRAAASA